MTAPASIVVTVDRTSTVTVARDYPSITTVVQPSTVETLVSPAPVPAVVELDEDVVEVVEVPRGPQGPPGPPGPSGDLSGTTDDLAEGDDNLYFTTARAAAAAPVQSVNSIVGDVVLDADAIGADPAGAAIAAASAAVSLHLATPDPHPQYIDNTDAIDGGNF
jgi:hypothetical protein